MKIRAITAIALVTAMAAACSEQTDSPSETTAVPDQQPQQSPMTTPDTDTRPMSETQPYAAQDPMADEPMSGAEPGAESTGPTATEFASFDTDSNGQLAEDEWEANAVANAKNLRNMSFAQIDRDGDGSINLSEFRKAKTDGGADEEAGTATESLDPTAP